MAHIGASFVRFYYAALASQDTIALRGIYAAESQLSIDDTKVAGAGNIINAHHSRLIELGKVKFNLTHVDSTLLPTKQVSVNVVGSILTELTEHHFVQSFILAPTEGRENTYYLLSEWRRTTNVVHDRTIARSKKDETAAPAAAAPVAAAVAAPVEAAAPAARPPRERREREPRNAAPAAAAVAPVAAAPVSAAPAAAPAPAAGRERRERKRACVEVRGIQKRTTIGDIEIACGKFGKVLGQKWRGRNAAVVEFQSLRVAEKLVAEQGLSINESVVTVVAITPEEFDAAK